MNAELAEGYDVRPLRIEDATGLAAAYDRNRAHLARWDPARPDSYYTVAGQEDALVRQLSLVQGGLLASWVLTHGEDLVGRVNLNNIVRGVLQSAAVGYWVDQDHLRRGLASAAVEHACVEGREMGLHRVEAGTMILNEASQRVLLKAGFTRYGTASKFLYLAGDWQDHHLYQRILHHDPLPAPSA